MGHILVLSDNPGCTASVLSGVAEADWKHSSLDTCTSDKLRRSRPDLLMLVGLPDPSPTMTFLRDLTQYNPADRTLPFRTVAILPRDLDPTDLSLACSITDDLILWPERTEVVRHRINRFLVPIAEIESACENLMADLGKASLIGRDPAFLRMADKIVPSARNNFPALITGETGTGKDLFARAIHFLSDRRNQSFVPVDCAGIPDHLFENELFGHVRGAYTDAHGEQRGLAAMADKGTLFLDEIDSLSLGAQGKLLRFLQDHQFKPLGAERYVHSDVRIVAASNRNLEQHVADKQFRSDLFFRLNVLHLQLPALRERPRDIPLLTQHFLSLYQEGGARKTITPSAMNCLTAYSWPGNVRELANIVQRAIVFSQGPQIDVRDIALPRASGTASNATFRAARTENIESFEREYVEELLRRNKGNITWAAREAGKERRAFGRLVKKYTAAHLPGAPGRF